MNQNQVEFDSVSLFQWRQRGKKKLFDSLGLVDFLGKQLWKIKLKKYCTD